MTFVPSSSPAPAPVSNSLNLSPTAIAVLASLGVHGVFFALLPLLPSPQEVTGAPPAPIPLVELSPTEQQRLPDLDRPALPLLPNDGSELYEFDEPPPGGTLFPGYGALPGSPVPRSQYIPRTIVPRQPSYSRSSGRSPLFISPSPTRPAPNSRQPALPQPTTPQSRPTDPLASGQIGFSRQIPELQGLDLARRSPNPTPSADPTPENPAVTPDPAPSAANPTTNPPAANDTTVTDRLRAEVAEMRRLYTYNGADTSAANTVKNMGDWLAATSAELETPDLTFAEKEPIDLEIPYDRRSCLEPEPGDASVVVVINRDRELITTPDVVGSTGFLGLDEAAQVAVSEYDFSAIELTDTDATKATVALTFRVDVAYDPENCLPLRPSAPAS